jgi:hypothetical protein
MGGITRLVGLSVVVSVVCSPLGRVGWAQQTEKPQAHLRPAPTPPVPGSTLRAILPLHLAFPQAAQPTPRFTARALGIPTPPPGGFGIVSSGLGGGGRFFDVDGSAEAWLGSANFGIQAFGLAAGGLFESTVHSAQAWVAVGDTGIQAYGNFAGGSFKDADHSGQAVIGTGDWGIVAQGNELGGYFKDIDHSGYAYVGYGDEGIAAWGNAMGGYFADSNGTGYAYVGAGDRGIDARGAEVGGYFMDLGQSGQAFLGYGDHGIKAFGNEAGGYFKDSDHSGYANVGYGDRGIEAYGNEMGGFFKDSNSSGYARVGYGDRGVEGYGNEAGGYFKDADHSGYAYVGYKEFGIDARGLDAGGYFKETSGSGLAMVATGDWGILAEGNGGGGSFIDLDAGAHTLVSFGTYKIYGPGSVSFVQNHPTDPGEVIVYAAPEGDEVATYTRGTARLVGGEAHVPLGETFKWVTNPDLGLTAHLTPHGEAIPLAVVSLTTEELVVRGPTDAPDGLVFDYLVYGLRIGFEESTVVQEKTRESYIPSMNDHRELLARRPDLARYTALARYSGERRALGITEELTLDRANALKAAIHEFDPAVDKVERPEPPEIAAPGQPRATADAGTNSVPSVPRSAPRPPDLVPSERPVPALPVLSDETQDLRARSFSSPREQLATRLVVSGSVEPGDVLVVDPERPEAFARGDRPADRTVVGVVVANAGVALGGPTQEGANAQVALSGIVRCKVDAGFGAIVPGDLLVSSPTPGHAMRDAAPLPGTVVGKALEPLASGQGSIRILIMLR